MTSFEKFMLYFSFAWIVGRQLTELIYYWAKTRESGGKTWKL